ncbi:MAG: apolipoprotein N-acyltransferase [Desulfobacteraceae bacterium]|nr:apolipoprotein N-acyltransferase [Desulfobacteraceae bacterium]MCB9494725.1 apolipoprotein N-acyltransferase [Desulfobacteraceae bacterium]
MKTIAKTLFYSFFSAALFTLSFSGYGLDFLIWFSLIPLFTLISSTQNKFKTGLIAGTIIYTSSLIWLVPTISNYGGLPTVSSFAAIVLLGFYLGLYTGIFSILFPDVEKKTVLSFFLIPALWTGLDFFSSFLFSGFPWVFAGYSQYKNLSLVQISSITGVYGITYYIVLINCAMFILFKSVLKNKKLNNPKNLIICGLTASITISIALYGNSHLQNTKQLIKKSVHITTALVQANIPPEKKHGDSIKSMLQKHLNLTRTAGSKFDLAIWPETALPYPVFLDKEILYSIDDFAKKNGNLIIGFLDIKKNNSGYILRNRAQLFPLENNQFNFYDKIHLVPFGEYIPLKKYFPFFSKFIVPTGEFSPGKSNLTFDHNKIRAGVKICFEIIFPGLVKDQVKNGANIIINLTNDAWFGKTAGPHQHLAISVLRAVENQRTVARCANTGISAHILPTGEIISKAGLFETKTIIENVPLIEEKTIYTKYGDFFAYICTFVLLSHGFLVYLKRRKIKKEN